MRDLKDMLSRAAAMPYRRAWRVWCRTHELGQNRSWWLQLPIYLVGISTSLLVFLAMATVVVVVAFWTTVFAVGLGVLYVWTSVTGGGEGRLEPERNVRKSSAPSRGVGSATSLAEDRLAADSGRAVVVASYVVGERVQAANELQSGVFGAVAPGQEGVVREVEHKPLGGASYRVKFHDGTEQWCDEADLRPS